MNQPELTAFASNARHVGRGLVTPGERNPLLTGLSYPSVPGFKEKGGTSEAAARAIAGRCKFLRRRCLEALRKKDMTADELADALGETLVSVKPRVSELVARHKVFRSRDRRKNANGVRVVVWTVFREAAMTVGYDQFGSRCLEALRGRDMTAEELANALGESVLNVGPRLSLLFAQRQVFKTGKRRKNASGREAVVWAVCTGANNDEAQTGGTEAPPCRNMREDQA